MNDTPADSISKGLTALAAATAAIASQLPGLAFFAEVAPPGPAILTLLTGGFTLALFVSVFLGSATVEQLRRRGIRCVLAAVILAIAYAILFDLVTVRTPAGAEPAARYQTGFGMMEFSLTPEALQTARENEIKTPQDLMLAKGAFKDGGPEKVWKGWTIITARVSLNLAFVLTYALWAYGLACLARLLTRRHPA